MGKKPIKKSFVRGGLGKVSKRLKAVRLEQELKTKGV